MAPNIQGNLDHTEEREPSHVILPKKEILYDNYYYDVTDWVKRHPGGRVIDYYTQAGEDATIAIQQFHFREQKKVAAILKSLPRRPVLAHNFEEELDMETVKRHRALTHDMTELHTQLVAEGYFDPSPWHVTYRIVETLALLIIGTQLVKSESTGSWLVGVILSALSITRCSFLVHECGHRALTGSSRADKILQKFFYGFGVGFSASWWSRSHTMHHTMPQRMERDVDLSTLPLLAFNVKVTEDPKNKKYSRNFMLRHQAILFMAVDTLLVTLFWKLFVHPRYALLKRKYGELVMMLAHTIFFTNLMGFWTYMLSLWLASMYMFGTFALSHTHLPVTTKALHWVEYGLLHTMDVEPSWWCDWVMGWLNYQVEHHLFPSIPHFRLHGIRERVRNLALKHDIPYQSVSYFEAIKKTLGNLAHVAKETQK